MLVRAPFSDPRTRRSALTGAGRGSFLLRAAAGIAVAVLVSGCGTRGADGSEPLLAPPATAALEATVPVADEALSLEAPDAEPRAPLQPDETLSR